MSPVTIPAPVLGIQQQPRLNKALIQMPEPRRRVLGTPAEELTEPLRATRDTAVTRVRGPALAVNIRAGTMALGRDARRRRRGPVRSVPAAGASPAWSRRMELRAARSRREIEIGAGVFVFGILLGGYEEALSLGAEITVARNAQAAILAGADGAVGTAGWGRARVSAGVAACFEVAVDLVVGGGAVEGDALAAAGVAGFRVVAEGDAGALRVRMAWFDDFNVKFIV